MRHRRWLPHAALRLSLVTTAALWLACGGGGELTAPTTGVVQVTTSTAGDVPDPDGYTLMLDDVAVQPIGSAATATLADLTPGAHRIGLAGVAPNCTVEGDNPRTLTVVAGETAAEDISITCSAGTGTLELTTASTGSPVDPSGYTVSVDGAAAVPIGVNATGTFGGLAPGEHSVALGDIACNCAVEGPNPRGVTITVAQTTTLILTVGCAAVTGSLAVTIAGLPSGTDAAITVTGPGDYSAELTATGTLEGLAPGQYTVGVASVSSGGTTYTSSPGSHTVTVVEGGAAAVTVTYIAAPGSSLNLWIAGLYLTQSVQTLSNEMPLIAGRDAFLRVFVRASENNTATPEVRVRLYDGDALIQTLTIAAPGGSVPLRRDEAALGASWNVPVPGSLIRPGLAFLADVDTANAIAEANETDNSFPTTGERERVSVRSAPPLAITLIPVRQSANQFEGDVTAGNVDQYLDLAQRIYPLPGYDAEVHRVYITDTSDPLQADDANNAWNQILSEIATLWVVEGSDRHYYGVVHTGYTSGLVGRGFLETFPVAIGYDEESDRGRITAHELGHTWERLHSPCGGPTQLDPQFPYPSGNIGRFGFDVRERILQQPETPDIMGYCGDPWISDYTYRGVMDFRGTAQARASAVRERPSLLVWGRIVNGRAVLEPAFQVVTRPVLPSRAGPYSIEGTASDGSRVFSLSFDATEVADDPRGARTFAYAVPLEERLAARLETIRLAGPGVGMATMSASPAALRAAPAEPISVIRSPAGVAVRWDAAAHPMIMVRDARTGEVLSFARGGNVVVPADGGEVELVMSDGVRSRSATVRTPR